MVFDAGIQDDQCMSRKVFATLRLEPMAVELASVEQVVSHPTDKPQDEFSLMPVIRENITPTQQAIRLLNLLFRRMVNVVLNRGL